MVAIDKAMIALHDSHTLSRIQRLRVSSLKTGWPWVMWNGSYGPTYGRGKTLYLKSAWKNRVDICVSNKNVVFYFALVFTRGESTNDKKLKSTRFSLCAEPAPDGCSFYTNFPGLYICFRFLIDSPVVWYLWVFGSSRTNIRMKTKDHIHDWYSRNKSLLFLVDSSLPPQLCDKQYL